MIYIILAMLLYAASLIFMTAASRNTSSTIVTALVNGFSAIIPLILAVPLLTKKVVATQRFGLLMAVIGGICIAFFGLSLAKSLSVNKVGIVSPIVFGGAIVLSTLASYFLFKEKISATQAAGLLLVLAGLCLVIFARATGR